MKRLLAIFIVVLPWRLRRLVLIHVFDFTIHPKARIGLSIIFPDHLEMAEGSQIGSLTVCKGIALLRMEAHSYIGNLNWITGFPVRDVRSFSQDVDRRPELIVDTHAAITNRHFVDCTNSVHVGRFAIFAGCRSQILTHSINLHECRQASEPIKIGEYCFVGTGSILLGGCALPNYSILAAGSVLSKSYSETHVLYGGTPARPLKKLTPEMAFFGRATGYVN